MSTGLAVGASLAAVVADYSVRSRTHRTALESDFAVSDWIGLAAKACAHARSPGGTETNCVELQYWPLRLPMCIPGARGGELSGHRLYRGHSPI